MTVGAAVRVLAFLAVISLCVGCAATPPKFGNAPLVPSDRVFSTELTMASPSKGEIYIARWTDAAGAAMVDARIYVDGQRVANVSKGEAFRAFVSPGAHTVGVKLLGLDSTEQPVRNRDVVVVAGGIYRFEVFWAGGGFDIQPHP